MLAVRFVNLEACPGSEGQVSRSRVGSLGGGGTYLFGGAG